MATTTSRSEMSATIARLPPHGQAKTCDPCRLRVTLDRGALGEERQGLVGFRGRLASLEELAPRVREAATANTSRRTGDLVSDSPPSYRRQRPRRTPSSSCPSSG